MTSLYGSVTPHTCDSPCAPSLPRSTKMARKIAGPAILSILVWFLQFKPTLGIGYPPVKPPISNHSEDENTTVYTVHRNETLRVSIKRISKEFEQILYKDNMQILALDRTNKTVYVNDSGSDHEGQLEKIQKYFHMKILNESYAQVIIHCETNFVEGNYTVQYNGVSLLDEPHPSMFSVRFAGSQSSTRPSPSFFTPSLSLAPSTQNYFTESLPASTRPSASFSAPSQSLAPTTQIASGQENLSTQSDPTIALSTSANGSTADESDPSIWIAVGIGIGFAVLAAAILVAFLV